VWEGGKGKWTFCCRITQKGGGVGFIRTINMELVYWASVSLSWILNFVALYMWYFSRVFICQPLFVICTFITLLLKLTLYSRSLHTVTTPQTFCFTVLSFGSHFTLLSVYTIIFSNFCNVIGHNYNLNPV
jgi:hypothetical protein